RAGPHDDWLHAPDRRRRRRSRHHRLPVALRRRYPALRLHAVLQRGRADARAPLPGGVRLMARPTSSTAPRPRATGPVARRQWLSRASRWVLRVSVVILAAVLVFLAYDTIREGGARLSWDFLTSYPSRFADQAGLRSSILGSIWVLALVVVMV